MTTEQIMEFLNKYDYDIRKTHFGRWIDQKCTPDVIWSVADFVLNYCDEKGTSAKFTVKDIWMSDYAKEIVREEFSKPDTDSEKVKNEFDKFFGQPLNLLCYAGVLRDISPNSRHLYVLNDYEMLSYIANNDMCSYRFLCLYIEKVLKDSGLWKSFAVFFVRQTDTAYDELKTSFENFCYNYTKISRHFETSRIFTKVLNPLACKYKKLGTKGGKISSSIIPKYALMYNQENFRDIYVGKPKNVSRKEWVAMQHIKVNYGFFEHQMLSVKRWLRRINDTYRCSISELSQFSSHHNDRTSATQIHHIFPRNEFPQIQHYLENLIVLTPNQHFGFAHPRNNTQYINLPAQKELLLAKTQSIRKNLESELEERIYLFRNLLYVLSEGWDDDDVIEIEDNNYADVVHAINIHYSDSYDEGERINKSMRVAEQNE